MGSFFHKLGLGIIAAFVGLTGAFHTVSTTTPATVATSTQKISTQQTNTKKSSSTSSGSSNVVLNNGQIIKKVEPAVVYITVSDGTGSGMVINSTDSSSLILTNAHVVTGDNSVQITLSTGVTYTGTVVGRDENNDLAIVSIQEGKLPTVQLGSSRNLSQGDNVYAIGFPFGITQANFTAGIVSNIFSDKILISAEIYPGNSGGPLINEYGQVVGITQESISDQIVDGIILGESLKAAIPIDLIKPLLPSLESGLSVSTTNSVSSDSITGAPITPVEKLERAQTTFYNGLKPIWEELNEAIGNDYNTAIDDYNLEDTFSAEDMFSEAKTSFEKVSSDSIAFALVPSTSLPRSYQLAEQNLVNAATACLSATNIMLNNIEHHVKQDASSQSTECSNYAENVHLFLEQTNPGTVSE